MTFTATALRATGVLGVTCLVLAVATLWLVFTEPVTVARVVQEGDMAALFEAVTSALAGFVRTAARYL
jgi:hypothetical protein